MSAQKDLYIPIFRIPGILKKTPCFESRSKSNSIAAACININQPVNQPNQAHLPSFPLMSRMISRVRIAGNIITNPKTFAE